MITLDPSTKKKVNVIANSPIVDLKIPFVGNYRNIYMTVADIRTCLHAKAKVEEIIGRTIIPLDFTNYDTDNTPVEAKQVVEVTPVQETIPVVEETITEQEVATEEATVEQEVDVVETETVEEVVVEEAVKVVEEKPATPAPTNNKGKHSR